MTATGGGDRDGVVPTHTTSRRAEGWEFIPADYFREARLDEIFGGVRGGGVEVDLGCGDGSFLVELAKRHPERSFLGVERLLGRVRKVSRKAERAGCENVRVLRLEIGYTVEWLLPAGAVDRMHYLFPDPWPKKRHRGRRLVNEGFVAGVVRVLRDGGEFLFKSDHAEFFAEAVGQLGAAGTGLEPREWKGGPGVYPLTDFERQWLSEGRRVHRARFVKVASSSRTGGG